MCNSYERLGTVSIEEFLEKAKSTRTVEFLGQNVKANGPRLNCFKKSQICSACSLKASFIAVERHEYEGAPETYHLNMYGIDSDGQEVFFTRDHTIPLSKGGPDNVSNTTTMCGPCNWTKADSYTKPKKLIVMKSKKVKKPKGPASNIFEPLSFSEMELVFELDPGISVPKILFSPKNKKATVRYKNKEDYELIKSSVDAMIKKYTQKNDRSYEGHITIFKDRSLRITVRHSNGEKERLTFWYNLPKKKNFFQNFVEFLKKKLFLTHENKYNGCY